MRKNINKWFTLIELMFVIAIGAVLASMSFVNYVSFQNSMQVKLASKEVSQGITNAKFMAMNWYSIDDKNQSVWIYLQNGATDFSYHRFDYDIDITDLSWLVLDNTNLIERFALPRHITIWDLSWYPNLFIYFSSIYWDATIYKYENNAMIPVFMDEIGVSVAFWDAIDMPYKRDMRYYIDTNVVDY